MKKHLLIIPLLLLYLSTFSQVVSIPDSNFKKALIQIGVDLNQNGEIEVSEALKVINLNVSNKSIHDMTGIESFKNLEGLACYQNELQKIDLSHNSKLKTLQLHNNSIKIPKLDFSKNTELTNLVIPSNGMDSLILKNNYNLKSLNYGNNPNLWVDFTQCPNLSSLEVGYNKLKSFDASNLPNLTHLVLTGNELTTLNVSKNYYLKFLSCQFNNLTHIDVTNNLEMDFVNGKDNPLKTICINTFQNIRLRNIYPKERAQICSDEVVIPDTNFRKVLINQGADKNNDGKISFGEAEMVTKISAANQNIKTLAGHDAFLYLTYLDISNNQIDRFSTVWHSRLETLIARNNLLETLDVAHKDNLKYLICENNKITYLNISNSPLVHLLCGNNNITEITTGIHNYTLKRFSCHNNKLTSINIHLSRMLRLEYLSCGGNEITSIDLKNNHKIEHVYCQQNKLNTLLTHATKIKALDCSNNFLTSLDISKNDSLKAFKVNNNNIDSICVSAAQLPLTNSWRKDLRTKWSLCGAPQNRSEEVGFLEAKETSVVYPNPASSEIRFQPLNPDALLIMRDMQGLEITKVKGKSSIDVSSLAPGVYLGEVRDGNQTLVKKIIIEK